VKRDLLSGREGGGASSREAVSTTDVRYLEVIMIVPLGAKVLSMTVLAVGFSLMFTHGSGIHRFTTSFTDSIG
jgi:hypothetical protein